MVGLVHCSAEKNIRQMDFYSDPNAGKQQDWNKQGVADLKRKLITANHILHHHGVVDAYGHVSARHPADPRIYIMAGYLAPALVTRSDDLIEYWVETSDPVNPNAKKGYAERFIHGEMFRMWPEVNCVVHSHAESVLPYVAAPGVPLIPVFHMAGFLGSKAPVFDIADVYQPGEQQDMLVRNARLGNALASHFSNSPTFAKPPPLDHNVVLMRRHGYTTHGYDIETAVYRGIYTKINAAAQTNTAIIHGSVFSGQSGGDGGFEPMSDDMVEGCKKMNVATMDKPWKLWVAEVENLGLYVNQG